jgi:hypothetical protein
MVQFRVGVVERVQVDDVDALAFVDHYGEAPVCSIVVVK